MDNTNERFVSEENAELLKFKGHDISKGKVHVGLEFELEGVKFRVRKVTHKDIVCRPIAWNQEDEEDKAKD